MDLEQRRETVVTISHITNRNPPVGFNYKDFLTGEHPLVANAAAASTSVIIVSEGQPQNQDAAAYEQLERAVENDNEQMNPEPNAQEPMQPLHEEGIAIIPSQELLGNPPAALPQEPAENLPAALAQQPIGNPPAAAEQAAFAQQLPGNLPAAAEPVALAQQLIGNPQAALAQQPPENPPAAAEPAALAQEPLGNPPAALELNGQERHECKCCGDDDPNKAGKSRFGGSFTPRKGTQQTKELWKKRIEK